MKSQKLIRFLSLLMVLVLLASVSVIAMGAEVTVHFSKDFGSNPYTGTSTSNGGFSPYVIDGKYGTDFSLEAVINIESIVKSTGRGIKFILRECPVASSKVLELWIGVNDIWACTDGWKGNGTVKGFNSESYWGNDLTVRIDISGDTIEMYLDGVLTWSWEDPSFSAGGETQVSLDGWDASYIIKSVRVTSVPEKPRPDEEHIDPVPEMGGTKYYVDSAAANGGDGLTPETAWNTIDQVNNHPQFLPDDQILFKRGSTFIGTTLAPKGYGIEDHPIIVDSYGEGALPILDRQGKFVPGVSNGSITVLLQNQSYWTFRNIQISNHNPDAPGTIEDIYVTDSRAEFPMRHGVVVQADFMVSAFKKIVRGITFENVVFDGIDTSHGDEGNCFVNRIDANIAAGSGGGALSFRANDHSGGDYRAYIDGISVENCTFHNFGGTAISTQSGWKYYDSFSNVVFRNNRIYNDKDLPLSGTGIYVVSCQKPLVEYNSLQDMTNGIGFQICTDATAQYNTVINMDGYLELTSRYSGTAQYWDGCGIDADCQCKGATTFKGNYLENCREGSFAFFDYNDTEPALITLDGNISYNCGSFMYYQCSNASYDFIVKNNTAVRVPGGASNPNPSIINVYAGKLDRRSIHFTNNIFYYPNQIATMETASSLYSGNLLEGIAGDIQDSGKLTGDPMLVLPTNVSQTENMSYSGGIAGTSSFLGSGLFTFQTGSPCIQDGKVICGALLDASSVPGPADPVTPNGSEETPADSAPVQPITLIVIAVLVVATAIAVFVILKPAKKK